MKFDGLMIHLQSWVESELAAQKDLRDALDGMLAAVMSAENEPLERATADLREKLEQGLGRDVRREDLLRRFSKTLGVPAGSLSVTSLIERGRAAGLGVRRLAELRDQLRTVALDVRRRARRLSVLAAHHGGVLEEILSILGCSQDGNAANDSGALVDARA